MTLKELLDRCDFKYIAPIIEKYYHEEAESMPHFKIAFDIMRHMKPKLNKNYESYKVVKLSPVKYDKYEREDKEQDYYIRVSCGGDYTESDLAKEVAVSKKLTLTDNEIAAHCLWEMTFFGFERLDDAHGFNVGSEAQKIDRSNPYSVAVKNLSGPEYSVYKGPKDLKKKPQKNWLKLLREHRLEKRIEKLERMAKVENSIRKLIANTKSFKRDELEYLFKTKLIYEDSYHSCVYNVHQRIDYLIDLLSNYKSCENFSEYSHFILMFRTSSEYPLTQRETDTLQNFFNQYLPASVNMRYGYGTNEKLGTEISLQILCSY